MHFWTTPLELMVLIVLPFLMGYHSSDIYWCWWNRDDYPKTNTNGQSSCVALVDDYISYDVAFEPVHWTINAIALSWRLVVVNDLPFIPSFLGLRENHLIYIPMKHLCRSNVGFYIHIGGWSWIHSHTDLDTRKKHWRHGITRNMSMKPWWDMREIISTILHLYKPKFFDISNFRQMFWYFGKNKISSYLSF